MRNLGLVGGMARKLRHAVILRKTGRGQRSQTMTRFVERAVSLQSRSF